VVLLVEDDYLVGKTLFHTLAPVCQVRWVESAEAALGRLETAPADVVLSDFHLAGPMTGTELLAHVAARWPATRRLLLSGDARALAGAAAHHAFRKPVELQALLDAVLGTPA
jgi:DNA-binding NtrC family response regulator